jgi:iron complex outermembrane receptor protein
VPASVTAINSALIERNNIVRIDQVAAITPNIQIQQISVNPTNISAYIRGIGNRAQEPSQDIPIAISIDGVYLADIAGSLLDVFDVQQIEVLRGPQGTLQGRNSPGGAINVTTRRPTGDLGARLEISYERFDMVSLKASVEGPIIDDKMAVKLSAFRNSGGGFMRNTQTGEDIGDIRNWGGRLGLLLTPSERVTVYLTADYLRDRSETPALRYVADGIADGPRQPVPAACVPYGYCTPNRKYESSSNFLEGTSSKNGGVGANIDVDLGNVMVTSITGFRYVNENHNSDVDNSPATVLHVVDRSIRTRAISQELRLASSGNARFNYLVGIYGIRSKFDLVQPLALGSGALGLPAPFFVINATSARRQVARSGAFFAQASYKITDRWSISGGARRTWDQKHMISTPSFPAASPADTFDDRVSFKNLSVEAGSEYKFDRNIMAYFRFAQGYRAGGFNGDASSVPAINTYRPEELDSYEVGLKTELFDRKMTANISAFHYNYGNIQILAVERSPTVGVVQRIVNGDAIKINGVELEMGFRPSSQLTFNGSLGYLDAKYSSQIVDIGFGPVDLKGVRKDYAPRWTGYFATDYRVPLDQGASGELVFGGSVNYKGAMATNPVDNPVGYQRQYALVDASITYRTDNQKYSVQVFGRNLTDKYYKTTGEAAGGFTLFEAVGRPRSYGIRGSAKF